MKSGLVYRANRLLSRLGLELLVTNPRWPIRFGIDPVGVELLADPAFQASIRECRRYSLLDTARLANLWSLSRMTNPDGAVIEVGAYRGGGALHISNAVPDRTVIVCDTFSGFGRFDPKVDSNFRRDAFRDTSASSVEQLFSRKARKYRIIAGEFPESVGSLSLPPLSFAHIDVDVYSATLETLRYVSPRMSGHSLIVIDDRNRRAEGVDVAVDQFLNEDHTWIELPIFPAQALLIHRSWFSARGKSIGAESKSADGLGNSS